MSRDDDSEDPDTIDQRPERRSLPIMRRTNPHGIPAVTVEEDSDGKLQVVESAPIDVRVDRIERDALASRRAARKLKGWIVAAVIAAGGSAGAVIVKFVDAREVDVGDRVRLQYLERRVDQLESYLYRWRRDDAPAPSGSWLPAQPAPPSIAPAPPGARP